MPYAYSLPVQFNNGYQTLFFPGTNIHSPPKKSPVSGPRDAPVMPP